YRDAKGQRRANGFHIEAGTDPRQPVGIAVIGRHRARYAVGGEIRIRPRRRHALGIVVGLGTQADLVAGAQKVVVGDTAVDQKAFGVGIADAELQRAGRTLGDIVVDVNQVLAAGHGLGVDLDIGDIGQACQARARTFDRASRKRCAFELAHFPTQGLVIGLFVAGKLDPAYIAAFTGIDVEGQIHGVVFVIDLGQRVDLGKGIAEIRQPRRDLVGGISDVGAPEYVTFVHRYQALHTGFRHDHVAGEMVAGNRVLRAFIGVDGEVDVLLVRRQRHLHRGNVE